MKHILTGSLFILVLWAAPAAVRAQNEAEIEEARAQIEQWVQVRQIISKEKTQWREEKKLLQERTELYKNEIVELDNQIETAEEDATAAGEKRRQLETEMEELSLAKEVIDEAAPKYEQRLLAISQFFPAPLRKKVKPLLSRIPKAGQRTKLSTSERMAVIAGILNEVDKFNSEVTKETEMRTGANGKPVAVQTLYFGLGRGFFVGDQNRNAGVLTPAAGEWEVEYKDSLAENISRAIGVYTGNIKPAEYVELPMRIKDVEVK